MSSLLFAHGIHNQTKVGQLPKAGKADEALGSFHPSSFAEPTPYNFLDISIATQDFT
ncbi:uncharacterized protein PHALS_00537 [Plasmopara halstedii]|uniref:Uncharacterized protein n=1 Tax=Plasmopara halstedii TaxID=4781 RepID=A0A0P1A7P4_PLAHL|nr:uncharacterized protein PHALS_00537 [Plasmopara halstedii]CEG36216.1 hypothetical protein PHALS_00537 [Plasmopara halstedii]|eukprot:XP_024572585.1 hypothetical protein PHALS_00537 [Plasmopara halstedii]